jgi:ketosteroid isomerase-like protein
LRPHPTSSDFSDLPIYEEMTNDRLSTDREALFAELLAAFGRRDNDVILAAMRPDVVLVLPGASPLAGTYRGIEELGRFVAALRAVLDTGRHEVAFEHFGDRMDVRHQVGVHGPQHHASMVLYQRFTFDAASKKITSITVEPEDPGLFDYVVQTAISEGRVSVLS